MPRYRPATPYLDTTARSSPARVERFCCWLRRGARGARVGARAGATLPSSPPSLPFSSHRIMTNSAGFPTRVEVAPAAAAAASVAPAPPTPAPASAFSYARAAPNWIAVMGANEVALTWGWEGAWGEGERACGRPPNPDRGPAARLPPLPHRVAAVQLPRAPPRNGAAGLGGREGSGEVGTLARRGSRPALPAPSLPLPPCTCSAFLTATVGCIRVTSSTPPAAPIAVCCPGVAARRRDGDAASADADGGPDMARRGAGVGGRRPESPRRVWGLGARCAAATPRPPPNAAVLRRGRRPRAGPGGGVVRDRARARGRPAG